MEAQALGANTQVQTGAPDRKESNLGTRHSPLSALSASSVGVVHPQRRLLSIFADIYACAEGYPILSELTH